MKLSIFLTVIFGLFAFSAVKAQTLIGRVTDTVDGKSLPFATIQVEGTTIGAITDFDGKFALKLKSGTYTLAVSFVGYATLIEENFVVGSFDVTKDFVLEPKGQTLEGVVVTGKRLVDTEGAVVEKVKEADQVVSAVSSEEIAKTEASDAGEVVSRIPGITLIDEKFIIVRGLNQRYNSVKLNGAPMPSTDPSTRAFAFDIIPSSVIESVFVYKSFTPDQSGEVAGASINIDTKNFVDEPYDKFGVKFGYRVGTTFEQAYSDPSRGFGDVLTFGKASREWGSEVENGVTDSRIDATLNREQALSFDNTDFFGKSFSAAPNFGISYGLGRVYDINEKELTFTGVVSLSNSTKTVEFERARYSIFDSNQAPANFTESSMDIGTGRSARLTAMANFNYEASEKLDISFHNLYNRRGSSSVIQRDVTNQDQSQNRLVENIDYLDETMLASQLGTTLRLNDFRDELTTVAAFAQTKFDQPNRRAYYRFKSIDSEDPYQFLLPDLGASLIGTTRFSSGMTENSYSVTSDYTHVFGEEFSEEDEKVSNISMKLGIFGEYRVRDFDSRNIAYGSATISGNPADFVGDDLQPDKIFLDENFFVTEDSQRGIVVDEKTQSVDRYEAFSRTAAAYLSFIIPIQDFTFNLGVRFENNLQNLIGALTQTDLYGSLDRDYLNNNLLPFFNASYSINENWQIRGAYSATVNRPELRELATFAYFDFFNSFSKKGNSDLKQATISNIDLRLEFYPGPAELISVAGFVKDFTNPIELVNISANDEYQTVNNESAIAYGVELEIRKNLDFISEDGIIGNTSFLLNTALVKSETRLSRQNAVAVNQNRPLQGQSPYVISSGLYYLDPETGWSVNVNYNTYGKRIIIVEGGSDRPPIYELPRQLIDLSISKELRNAWEVKLAATNILNAEYKLYFDGDFDEDISIDESLPVTSQTSPLFQRYREGQKLELSFSKKF